MRGKNVYLIVEKTKKTISNFKKYLPKPLLYCIHQSIHYLRSLILKNCSSFYGGEIQRIQSIKFT
jgi:hypothetical protein